MGVFIDYAFRAECSEEELLERLRRLRRKLKKLSFRSVGKILRVDPAYEPLPIKLLQEHGYPLPPAVAKRLRGKLDTKHREWCHLAAPPAFLRVPKKVEEQFYRPALQFAKNTDLWRYTDLPAKLEVPYSFTFFRLAFAMEMANVMLRHGFLLLIDPGEGCETFAIGLTSYRTVDPPLWLGSGFTKTQYATHFVQVHERICRGLDLAQEEGLLLDAKDTCKFYEHRHWVQSAPIVNEETTFAHVMGGLIDAGIQAARKSGVKIEDLSDPATRNYNLVRVEDAGKNKSEKE
jgi:hypothetical protein